MAAVGLPVLGYVLVKRRPQTPAALSRLIGWVMAVAILLAPATRVGYLLYPIDFFVWAWLLRGEDTVDPPADSDRGVRGRARPGPGARRRVRATGPDRRRGDPGARRAPGRGGPGEGDGGGGTGATAVASSPRAGEARFSPGPTPRTAVA